MRHSPFPLEAILNTDHYNNELISILQKHQSGSFYVGTYLPPEKVRNATAHFPIPRQETILGLIDCTVFGSCKNGLAITNNGLIWKNDWATDSARKSLTWRELIDLKESIQALEFKVIFAHNIHLGLAGSSVKPTNFIALCYELIDFFVRTESIHQQHHQDDANDDDIESSLLSKCILIKLVARFVKSDGAISRKEIAFIEELFDVMSNHDATEKRIFINFFNKVKDVSTPFEEITNALRQNPATDEEDFFSTVYKFLWELALVDGQLSPIKHDLLKTLRWQLGLHQSAYEESAADHLGAGFNKDSKPNGNEVHLTHLNSYFELLGCACNSSDTEIKTAYRRKMSALHPDKLQSKDLAEELLQFANQQVQKINVAYEEIMKYRNY